MQPPQQSTNSNSSRQWQVRCARGSPNNCSGWHKASAQMVTQSGCKGRYQEIRLKPNQTLAVEASQSDVDPCRCVTEDHVLQARKPLCDKHSQRAMSRIWQTAPPWHRHGNNAQVARLRVEVQVRSMRTSCKSVHHLVASRTDISQASCPASRTAWASVPSVQSTSAHAELHSHRIQTSRSPSCHPSQRKAHLDRTRIRPKPQAGPRRALA